MFDINYLAVLVAAVAAVVVAAVYYTVFGKQLAALSSADDDMPPWLLPVELLRSFVLALVVSIVATGMLVDGWGESLLLAAALWAGFPVVLLSGSVVHEKVPVKLAVLHSGDWLLKLLVITVVVGLWR